MRTLRQIIPILLVAILLASCSGTQNVSAYDDVYYSPADDVSVSVDDRYVDGEYEDYSTTEGKSSDEDYFDPDYRRKIESADGKTIVNNYYGNYYESDDYYYSNRLRRFNRPGFGFNYYDPFYSYGSWYSYDNYFWRPIAYRPFSYRPGWGFSWNNNFGWTANYAYGFGNYYPFAGYSAYNPWNYYGNVYCPSYSPYGYANNDFYYDRTPIYTGQYTSMSSFSSSSSTILGRDFGKDLPGTQLKPASNAVYPVDSSRPASVGSERPAYDVGRAIDSNDRPVREDSPRDIQTRPVNSERPSGNNTDDYVRPRDTQTSPRQTRPVETTPRDNVRPQNEKPKRGLFKFNRSNDGSNSRGGNNYRAPRNVSAPVVAPSRNNIRSTNTTRGSSIRSNSTRPSSRSTFKDNSGKRP